MKRKYREEEYEDESEAPDEEDEDSNENPEDEDEDEDDDEDDDEEASEKEDDDNENNGEEEEDGSENKDEEDGSDNKDEEVEAEDNSTKILDWFMGDSFAQDDLLLNMQPDNELNTVDFADRFQLLDGTAYQESHDDAYTRFVLQNVEDQKHKESILYRLRSVSIQKDKTKRFELSSSRGGLVLVAIKSSVAKEMEAGIAKVVECAVCLSIMTDPCTLPCGHSGCLACLERCFATSGGRKCPQCKDVVDAKLKLKVNIVLRESISIMAPHHAANLLSGKGDYKSLGFQSDITTLREAVLRHRKSFKNLKREEDQLDLDGKSLFEAACYRLCRRAGVISEDTEAYNELESIRSAFMESITRRIDLLQVDRDEDDGDAKRKPVAVCADDVIAALREHHLATSPSPACQVYGFGGRNGLRHAFSEGILAILSQKTVTRIDPIALSVMNDLVADYLFMLHDRAVQYGNTSSKHVGSLAKVKAGPTDAHNDCDDSAHVSLFVEREDCEGFDLVPATIKDSLHVINVSSVRNAVCARLCSTELLKYSTEMSKDALKSAIKFATCNDETLDVSESSLSFTAEHIVRLCSERSPYKGTYTIYAGVYLTAALDYMCHELFDVAQNIAEEETNCFEITSRHILLGIRGDAELVKLFPGAIRDGGVEPIAAIAPPFNGWKHMVTEEEDDGEDVAVTRMLVAKAHAQALREGSDLVLGVDPRDGHHFYYYNPPPPPTSTTTSTSKDTLAVKSRIYPAPMADMLCQVEVAQRKAAAIAALSASEAYVCRRLEESNASDSSHYDQEELLNLGEEDAIDALEKLFRIRLREIRCEQRSTHPLFHPAEFARSLQKISSSVIDADIIFKWSDEAAQVAQAACENQLIHLVRCSNGLTRSASMTQYHLRKLKYCFSW